MAVVGCWNRIDEVQEKMGGWRRTKGRRRRTWWETGYILGRTVVLLQEQVSAKEKVWGCGVLPWHGSEG